MPDTVSVSRASTVFTSASGRKSEGGTAGWPLHDAAGVGDGERAAIERRQRDADGIEVLGDVGRQGTALVPVKEAVRWRRSRMPGR